MIEMELTLDEKEIRRAIIKHIGKRLKKKTKKETGIKSIVFNDEKSTATVIVVEKER